MLVDFCRAADSLALELAEQLSRLFGFVQLGRNVNRPFRVDCDCASIERNMVHSAQTQPVIDSIWTVALVPSNVRSFQPEVTRINLWRRSADCASPAVCPKDALTKRRVSRRSHYENSRVVLQAKRQRRILDR